MKYKTALDRARDYVRANLEPEKHDNGACKACCGWLCEYHRAIGLIRDYDKAEVLRLTVAGIKRAEVGRVIVSRGIESDEGGTAEQKARRVLSGVAPVSDWHIVAGI